jgi:Rrf2 family transcriptional regulator, nitric oxide-sensitive transcriptional repressor
MRLTSFTDFGLRALMRLASDPDRAFSTAELAEEFNISSNHLTKIIAALAQARIVTTRRGGGGGAILARPADQIKLGDIVRVLAAGQALVECFSAGEVTCSLTRDCRLKSRLRSAEAAFLADLDRSSLASIALPVVSNSESTA